MNLSFPKQHITYLERIAEAGRELGFPVFVIGGYVRDLLLERPCKDIDIVCEGSGIELAQRAARKIKKSSRVAVFSNFGTAMFEADGIQFEFVGARRESYQRDSRKPIVEDGTLTDDQNRRDFTINALAISLCPDNYGTLIDPFNGIDDLQNGIIRTPLADADITFSDDPLRMLRAIRFANQLKFRIHPNTYDAVVRNRERLKIISSERISDELNKIMRTDKPSVGFLLLFKTGLLPLFFPELQAMHGVEVRDGIGHKDNFFHTLKVLDNICPTTQDLRLRWAALLHDIGKPATKRFDPQEGWTFHGHEAVGERMVPGIFKRLKLPTGEDMRYVQKMVALHQRPIILTKEIISDSAIRRILFEAGNDIDDLMLLCQADITSQNEEKVRRYLDNYQILKERMKQVEESDNLRNWQPPIDGACIMQAFGIKPGREVGIIKNAIRDAILDGIIPNEYEPAYQLMLQQGAAIGLNPIDIAISTENVIV